MNQTQTKKTRFVSGPKCRNSINSLVGWYKHIIIQSIISRIRTDNPKNSKIQKNPKIDLNVEINHNYKHLKHKYVLQIFNYIFIFKCYLK